MNYKTFDYPYSKENLLALYQRCNKQDVSCYSLADLADVPQNMFPRMDIFERKLDIKEYVLGSLIGETGFQTNPGNNGLIIFPVDGVLEFTFEDGTVVEITEPTITNGKVSHNIKPKNDSAVFFAIKIPEDMTWLI